MNGKIYIGEWKYYQNNSNQLLTLEHFDANGNLTGDRFIYYVNGKVAEKEQYKNGRLDGSSLWYSEEGKILKEFIYNNGELHGLSKYYSPTGELIIEGAYKEGQKAGIWKYYENGKLTEEKDYSK
jgi:antitoxin component YwqK of YwqJK toxin-antitoxin module